MSDDGKVFGKFNVTRTDGQSEPNRKHDGCDYFVLDTTCDEFALHALRAYIDACKETHPKLAADMERLYRVPRKASDDHLYEMGAADEREHGLADTAQSMIKAQKFELDEVHSRLQVVKEYVEDVLGAGHNRSEEFLFGRCILAEEILAIVNEEASDE